MDRFAAMLNNRFGISSKEQLFFTSILIALLARTSLVTALPIETPIEGLDEALPYLKRFGYIPRADTGLPTSRLLRTAMGRFQALCGVPQTGLLDQATKACMQQPRCGNPDIPVQHQSQPGGRKKRYYIPPEGAVWSPPSTHMTYDVVTYSEDLPPSVIDDSIRRAFELWSNSTLLTFERVRGREVDISIHFYSGEHGDDMPFDGPGRVLAHAFWPWNEDRGSDVHLDEGETWTSGSYSGANLWLVVAHEIGHSLGLGHTAVFGALMFPFHFGYSPSFKLHQDDIAGIGALYGDSAPTLPPDVPNICQVAMDAIMVDGFTYIFKGNYFWQLSHGNVDVRAPKRISDKWPGMEGDIDAAITIKNDFVWTPHTGKTYFFKGRRIWRYTLSQLDPGFPKDVTEEFQGFPSDIQRVKGIFEISGNGETYFFTDDGFYVHTWLGFQGPFELAIFGGIENNIVSAVQAVDNYIYIFTDNRQYYQCSPWWFTVSRGYPRLAHVDWLSCPSNSQSSNLRLATEFDTLPMSPTEHKQDGALNQSSGILCASSTLLFTLLLALLFKA